MFFFKFIMIRLLSRHHPAANPSPPFPLCPAAGQRGRGGEGLAEAQLPYIFQDGVSPFAPGPPEAQASCLLTQIRYTALKKTGFGAEAVLGPIFVRQIFVYHFYSPKIFIPRFFAHFSVTHFFVNAFVSYFFSYGQLFVITIISPFIFFRRTIFFFVHIDFRPAFLCLSLFSFPIFYVESFLRACTFSSTLFFLYAFFHRAVFV